MQAFLDEAEAFPGGEHDDQVDAASTAYLVLTGSAWRLKAQKRRVAVGLVEYAKKLTPPCPSCGQPVYWPPATDFVSCPHCGQEMVREVVVRELV